MALSHRCLWLSLTGDLDSITELHGGRVFNLRAIPLTACRLGPLLALSRHLDGRISMPAPGPKADISNPRDNVR